MPGNATKPLRSLATLPGRAWLNGWWWACLLPVFIVGFAAVDVAVPLSISGQVLLSIPLWWIVLGTIPCLSKHERRLLFVFIPTILLAECAFSLWLGIYTYRLDNIPAFLVPGHGIVFLTALRAARINKPVSPGVLWLAAAAQMTYAAVQLFRANDVFGLIGSLLFVLVLFVIPARAQRFYITLGAVVAYLEIVGTNLGLWTWGTHLLGIPHANPPSGAVAGYLGVDAVAYLIAAGITVATLQRYPLKRLLQQTSSPSNT